MSEHQSTTPEHEPEAGSSERLSPIFVKAITDGLATFALEFGKAMARVNQMVGFEDDEAEAILEASAKAATAGLDEADE